VSKDKLEPMVFDDIPDVGDALRTISPTDDELDAADAAPFGPRGAEHAPMPFLALPDVGASMQTVYPADEIDEDAFIASFSRSAPLPAPVAAPEADGSVDPLDAPDGLRAPEPFAPLPSLSDFEDRIDTVLAPDERDASHTLVPSTDDEVTAELPNRR
jgi:hypothetical protein